MSFISTVIEIEVKMENLIMVALWGIASLCALAAFIITYYARSRLTAGILKLYLTWTLGSLFFIILNNIYTMLLIGENWAAKFGPGIYIPQYLLMAMGCLFFVIAAYQVHILSKIYGFKEEGEKIKTLIEESIKKIEKAD